MSFHHHDRASRGRKLAFLTAALAGALLLPALATAAPTPLQAPTLPTVAGLPGPVAPAAKTANSLGILKSSPDTSTIGKSFTLSGTGLPANKDVTLTWSTSNVTWVVDARPDSVDYLGRKADKFNVVIGSAKTDGSGSFSKTIAVPRDFGGIHDIYGVVDGVQVAKGGLLISRSITMTPKQGPIGTMITIRYSGIGASLYEHSNAIVYDNKYTGTMVSNWTRGVSVVHIRASGPVGKHYIEVADATPFKYLNIQQSPIHFANGFKLTFDVTKDAGRPAQRIDWPLKVASTFDERTTLQATGLTTSSSATASLSSSAGAVNSKVDVSASGLTPGAPVELAWSTVVGNRVNCSGTCWNFVSVPLANATAGANGTVTAPVTVPDGLGGWHVVQVLQNGEVKAQVPYYVRRSVVGKGVSQLVLKEGQSFQIHLKGVGWTQLDNTVAVDYDNAYIGYGCGFNSNGDVGLNLVATGGPGTHLIDMYPLLYTLNPSYANTPNGMLPMLTYADDLPGLALGYELPAIRLAITIVK
jgi:hypothetical protein